MQEPMKILFVCSAKPDMSVAPFIKSQADSLVSEGLLIDYFKVKGRGLRSYIRSIPLLRKKVKENNYNIVHAHYALCGWVALLAFTGLPLIVSYMGSDVYGSVNSKGKRTLFLNIMLAKLLQPFVNRIIVKSKNLESYVYMKKKCVLIPNGVNFSKFKPLDKAECRERLGLAADKKIVLFLGNPKDPRKNIRLLKEALGLMNRSDVILAAPYPVPHNEVPVYINAADVFTLTSFLEGSPNVVKEAMACNCPVVATDAGDVREVVGRSRTCYVADFDSRSVAECINKVLDNDQEENLRNNIADLDEKKIVHKILQVYTELI